MENLTRTAEHLVRMSKRRSDLQSQIVPLCPASAKLVCEFGCGHGHFLSAYAAAHPDRLCVGVDISGDRIGRALRKRDRAKLPNLHFIQADAGHFLDVLPKQTLLTDIFILFPDPWPKRRHHKNRLLQADFLHEVAVRAGKGAHLYFRTDHQPYFDDTESLIRRHPDWEIASSPWPFEQVTVFESRAAHHSSLVARLRSPPLS